MLNRRSLLKNKKADLTGVLYFIVSVAAFAIFLLIVGYIGKTIGTQVKAQINSTDTDVNNAFNKTVQISTSGLSALWWVLFGGLLIGLMITAWFIPTHPVFVVPFLILLVVGIIVGAAMSDAYDALKIDSHLSATAAEQGGIGFMMGNLPYIALIVGLLTLVVTFAKPSGAQTQVM